jgi:hypothetical protein
MPRLCAAVLLVITVAATPALAWNKPTHQIIGAIAYDVLKQDGPATIPRVVNVLKRHPQYDTFAKRLETVPAADRDRYLFMQAARWPDDARDNKAYHHGPWHYINNPVVAQGYTAKRAAPAASNILTALDDNVESVKRGTEAEKAIAVCWLMHLVGDLHQPLHAVSYFNADHPSGDKGGNGFYVRVSEGRAVIDMHSLWDGLLGSSQTYRATGNAAIELRRRPDFARAKLTELKATNAKAWADESVKISRDMVYAGGTLKGGTDRTAGPVLPDGYAKRAKAIAERRVVLAGYKLAEALKRATLSGKSGAGGSP